MSTNMSTYLADKLLRHALMRDYYNPPATLYLALFTTPVGIDGSGDEVTGGSYARVAIPFGSVETGVAQNSTSVSIAAATADWGRVTHWAVYDALTGGNLMVFGELNVTREGDTGNSFIAPIGNFKVSMVEA